MPSLILERQVEVITIGPRCLFSFNSQFSFMDMRTCNLCTTEVGPESAATLRISVRGLFDCRLQHAGIVFYIVLPKECLVHCRGKQRVASALVRNAFSSCFTWPMDDLSYSLAWPSEKSAASGNQRFPISSILLLLPGHSKQYVQKAGAPRFGRSRVFREPVAWQYSA